MYFKIFFFWGGGIILRTTQKSQSDISSRIFISNRLYRLFCRIELIIFHFGTSIRCAYAIKSDSSHGFKLYQSLEWGHGQRLFRSHDQGHEWGHGQRLFQSHDQNHEWGHGQRLFRSHDQGHEWDHRQRLFQSHDQNHEWDHRQRLFQSHDQNHEWGHGQRLFQSHDLSYEWSHEWGFQWILRDLWAFTALLIVPIPIAQSQSGFCLIRFFAEVDMVYIPPDPPLVLHMLAFWWLAVQLFTSPYASADVGCERVITRTQIKRSTIVPATRLFRPKIF